MNRPEVRNALHRAASDELDGVWDTYEGDPDLRVAILTGAGDRAFSAGYDVKDSSERRGAEFLADRHPRGIGGLTHRAMAKPIIAAANGFALGGGLELALACDLIVAVPGARFSLPEVKLGLVPDSGGMFRLERRLPRPLAMELLLTGRPIDAAEATRWGIVNRLAEAGDLMAEARALAAELEAVAPLATRAVKAVLAATEGMTVEEAFAALRDGSIPAYDRAMASADAEEGPRAFAEGRDPVWRGE
jgi:crotonobetainyl-CoA hydratase